MGERTETIWYAMDKALREKLVWERLPTMKSEHSEDDEGGEHSEINYMEKYIASINAEITNKCDFTEMRAICGEYVRVISFAKSSTTRIGEVIYVIRKFLDIYPGVSRFIVRFKTTKIGRTILADHFSEYTVNKDDGGWLLFRLKARV